MGSLKKISKDLEGVHYSILQEYLETGNSSLVSNKEMILYLEQLDKVRGWHYSLLTESKIIKALMLDYADLSSREAKSRYSDAINYFYGDTEIKKEAYRNMMADEMYKIYTAAILSAKEDKDYKNAADILFKAATLRGVFDEDKDTLPESVFENKTPIYVMNPELVGLPKADRNILADQIDKMAITELKKKRLKGEAGIGDLELFEDE